jgi:hypothetical protein
MFEVGTDWSKVSNCEKFKLCSSRNEADILFSYELRLYSHESERFSENIRNLINF